METTTKFKEGDTVRIKDTPNVRVYDEDGQGVGKIFKIHAEYICGSKSNPTYLHPKNEYATNYNNDDLELVTEINWQL